MAEESTKPDLTGHWVLDHNDENFDNYLQALGLSWFVRKMIGMASVTVDISKEDDKIEINTHTSRGDLIDKFIPGEEYDMNNVMRGKIEKKKGYWDGDVLVIEPVEDDSLPVSKRTIRNGFLLLTTTVKGVSATRYFKKK
ncbi:Myelin P2 protein [Holothuria leucospilota]|uniref:Myelin P2 protein n=1 Tax=Holothuria leucospilota TaxID=206669 RepID=A0A9Q1CFV4_HOLLE|nr:Myelin P2 protein [Holothuria leucospilota]